MWKSLRAWLTGEGPFVAGALALATLAGWPLLRFEALGGHDARFYLPGAAAFYRQLADGKLLPRWAPELGGGYGLPYFVFRPPLYYTVSSLFHALGFTFVASEDLALLSLLALAGLGMYGLARSAYGRWGGLVSAGAYLFAPYLLVNLYVRHALLDFAAFAFMPLAVWGLSRYANENRRGFGALGALAAAAVVLASNTSALMFLPLLAGLSVWLAVAGRDWRRLARGLWVCGLAVGMTAFYWLPVLAERRFVHLERAFGEYLYYSNHFVFPHQLVYSAWGYGLSGPGDGDGMSFAIGPVHLALAALALVVYLRLRGDPQRRGSLVGFFVAALLGAAFLTLQASAFIWERLSLLQLLQFPWRFLSIAALASGFLSGAVFLVLPKGNRWLAPGAAALLGALLAVNAHQARPGGTSGVMDEDLTPARIAARGVRVTWNDEYRPIWVRQTPEPGTPGIVTRRAGAGVFNALPVNSTHYVFQAELDEPGLIQVNQHYYPGWRLWVDGVERAIDFDNPEGLMFFALEPGPHTAELAFRPTPLRRWAGIASGLALAALVGTLGWSFRRAAAR